MLGMESIEITWYDSSTWLWLGILPHSLAASHLPNSALVGTAEHVCDTSHPESEIANFTDCPCNNYDPALPHSPTDSSPQTWLANAALKERDIAYDEWLKLSESLMVHFVDRSS